MEGEKAVLEKIQRRAVSNSMASGLKDESYEEKLLELNLPTLEERRHHADMVQTFKIVKGIDRVEHGTWFQLGAEGGRATRSADCPHNLRQMAARLEGRRKFLLQPCHRELESDTKPSEECENSEQLQAWLQNLQSRTGTSHMKEYESREDN